MHGVVTQYLSHLSRSRGVGGLFLTCWSSLEKNPVEPSSYRCYQIHYVEKKKKRKKKKKKKKQLILYMFGRFGAK